MMTLNISGTEYKVKFTMNSFADSDLIERVKDITEILNAGSDLSTLKTVFIVVRELFYVGFQKYTPVDTVEEVGDLLDTYFDETPKDEDGNALEDRGIISLFMMLLGELSAEGFLGDFMEKMMEVQKSTKKPQDHQRKKK